MTDKKRKKAREMQAKTGMSYASAINQINTNTKDPLEETLLQINKCVEVLDLTVSIFCECVVKQVSAWYISRSETLAEGELRDRVTQLIQNVRAETRDRLDDGVESIWWHRAIHLTDSHQFDSLEDWDYTNLASTDESHVSSNLHGKIQYLLDLMEGLYWEYGMAPDWGDWAVSVEAGAVSYTQPTGLKFEWSPMMAVTLNLYVTGQRQLRQLQAELVKVRQTSG